MSDMDSRIRETLDRVADTTEVHRRVDEIVQIRQRRPVPRFAIGLVAFAAVLAVFALPLLLAGTPSSDVGGGFSPSPDIGTTSADETSPSSEITVGSSSPNPNTPTTPPSETAVTVDPDWLTVEPEDIAAFHEMSLSGDGERAPLRTETIWCFYDDYRPIETFVAGVAVDEPVTSESLISTCAGHPEVATEDGQTTPAGTVCRAVIADSTYEEMAAAGEWDITPEEIARPKPGFPVILMWESDCLTESLESSPPVNLSADLSLDAVNRARELELAVRGASLRQCLSFDEAAALTDALVEELGEAWLREPPVGAAPASKELMAAGCHQPQIEQQWGFVFPVIERDAPDPQTTESTIPPTTP